MRKQILIIFNLLVFVSVMALCTACGGNEPEDPDKPGTENTDPNKPDGGSEEPGDKEEPGEGEEPGDTDPGEDVIVGGKQEVVDLGLPSGTLWASCNLGADSPEQFGAYFAWAEVKPKKKYGWDTYEYATYKTEIKNEKEVVLLDELTKYFDATTPLEKSDDAAFVNWGGDWRLPTNAEFTELTKYCYWSWTEKNGVKGCEFSGNGNSIFLPAAGFYDGDILFYDGSGCYYWSSDIGTQDLGTSFGFYSEKESYMTQLYAGERCVGNTIRAVKSGK